MVYSVGGVDILSLKGGFIMSGLPTVRLVFAGEEIPCVYAVKRRGTVCTCVMDGAVPSQVAEMVDESLIQTIFVVSMTDTLEPGAPVAYHYELKDGKKGHVLGGVLIVAIPSD